MKSTHLKLLFVYWLPVILWALIIFFLSSRPNLKVATGVYDFLTRKPAHIFEYLILSVLVFRANIYGISNIKLNLQQKALISFIITVIYAISDEIHQSFVPLREGKLSDLAFDSVGAFLGVFLIWRLFQTQKRKQEALPKNLPKN